MDEIVFIQNNRVVTDSLTVARIFCKRHDNVMRDIDNILSEVESEWGALNFEETHYRHPQNSQMYQKYILTEDGFTLLVMGYTGHDAMKFKINYIQQFRNMQKQLQTPRELTRLELIELARESELARLETEKKNAELEYQIRLQEPKLALYNVAMQADNAQQVGTVAKTLNVGPYKLFGFLRDKKVFFRRGRDNLPYQEYIDRGYFTVRQYPVMHNTSGIENKPQIMVTARGMEFIHKLLEESKKSS